MENFMNKLQKLLNGKIHALLLGDMFYQLIKESLQPSIPPRYADVIGKWEIFYVFYPNDAGSEVGPDFWDNGVLIDMYYHEFMFELLLPGKWKP